MNSRLVCAVFCFLSLVGVGMVGAQAGDDIPDNCEYPYAAFYRPNVFPRYEPQNRRLVLVDWTSGADVAVLDTDLDDTLIRSWSASCRYLAVATGSYDSRDTRVYDTVEAHFVGSVPDAHAAAHPLTWGPKDFLMVEGRNGAVLWNVPTNIQYPLDVGFNTTTYRNFSRLRWDADHDQLTANLAVGGRIVYDLNTGQPTIVAGASPGELVVGGERFACEPTRREQGGAYVSGLYLDFAHDGGVVYLGGWSSRRESLATLEAGLTPNNFQSGGYRGGWSINCRYVAGTFSYPLAGTEHTSIYDTYIWDVLEGRRVGVFPDARIIAHELTWDTAEKNVLVQTRNGAYLWNLETDARVLVNATVEQPPYNCEYHCKPRSFEHVYWDAGRQQMLGIPVQSPDSVIAYDVNTGAEVARYTVEGAAQPLGFITSNDSRLLLAHAGGIATLWNRETGAALTFESGIDPTNQGDFSRMAAISTDNHYLAIVASDGLRLWDLTALTGGSAPIALFDKGAYDIYFLNGDTLDLGYWYERRLNVVTGEVFGSPPPTFDPLTQSAQTFAAIPGTSGRGALAPDSLPDCPVAARYDRNARQLIVHDLNTDEQRILEADLNFMPSLWLSPDCQTVFGDVRLLNTSLPYDETPAYESYYYAWQTKVVFWDVNTGERIGEVNANWADVWWSPDGERALIVSWSGNYLFDPASRSLLPIRFQDTDRGHLPSGRIHTYWDYGRGLVLVSGYGEVFAIDMTTGVERLRFPAQEGERGGCYAAYYNGCGLGISDDGKWVFVYGDYSLGVWNIDTLDNTTLPMENGERDDGALISPDGRYLVVSRTAVRVWDLATLPADFDARLPIATYGVGNQAVMSTRFVDDSTLEVITHTADGTATTDYDVATGAVLP